MRPVWAQHLVFPRPSSAPHVLFTFLAELKHQSLGSEKSLRDGANQLGKKARKTKDLTRKTPLLPGGELGHGGARLHPQQARGRWAWEEERQHLGIGPYAQALCLVLLSSSALEVIL